MNMSNPWLEVAGFVLMAAGAWIVVLYHAGGENFIWAWLRFIAAILFTISAAEFEDGVCTMKERLAIEKGLV